MNNLYVFLIILLIIVIIATSMMSYKIETFTNLSDPTVFPQTPNNETCYDYIKNVKKWNVNELTEKQRKVLFTMRALLGSQYSDNSKVFPFKDGCVIPYEHLPIFDTGEETKSLTFSPKNKAPITISSTDNTMYPQGLYVDFTDPTLNYNKFKDILDGGYLLYDSEFLIEENRLKEEIKRLTKIRDSWKQVLANLVYQTKTVVDKTALLTNPNSECQRAKTMNVDLHNKWNRLIDAQNYYSNRYWTLYGYIQNGKVYLEWLKRVASDASIGRWWFHDGGSVNLITNKPPPKNCSLPSGWCVHGGVTPQKVDCGDGISWICEDKKQGYTGSIRGPSCTSIWPAADISFSKQPNCKVTTGRS